MIPVFESTSASERLAQAAEFIRGFPASTEVLILANSREAADDFVRAFFAEAEAVAAPDGADGR